MRAALRVRQVVNAVNLSTLLGLGLAKVAGARLDNGPDGLVLATSARRRLLRASAYTVGNVVITTRPALDARLLAHESRHATQWAWCVVLFLPLYALAMLWSYAVTGDHFSRNWFERRAGLADGHYVERALRWRRRTDDAGQRG
jgi:hypothetical protein